MNWEYSKYKQDITQTIERNAAFHAYLVKISALVYKNA
jgi:hypothetical protein